LTEFSVLMSIYYKEKPEYFDRAMKSIWDEQSVKPSEIVLVQDGPLNDELYESISNWQDKLGSMFKTVILEINVGLGDALNIGLENCNYDIVARMDTDDIAIKDRFEKQLKVFENSDIDICSSWVGEFDSDEKVIVSYRKIPEIHEEIVCFSKMRNAINHPAVIDS
jgi:glycosyltransferase involved in cell wall biosynthesis